MKSLFNPIVEEKKLNESFKSIIKFDGNEPGRLMMDNIFQDFKDIDGNFIEQFQTTGFDQRIFELYLFAYFKDIGFDILRNYDRPDFILRKSKQRIAVEATTASESGKIPSRKFTELSGEEKQDYLINEIPIRLGSSLFSKLKKQYWKLKQCQDIPFIIAVESFYDKDSLLFSSSSLSNYLYGLELKPLYDNDGILSVKSTSIDNHKLYIKQIPSGFFNQPESENVSAIIFTNSGTFAKFNRMGYYNGYYSNSIKMIRNGNCYDYDPNSSMPKEFAYDLDDTFNTPLMETWGQGIEIFHNPNAKIPLNRGIFRDAAEHYLENGILYADIPKPFHPFSSLTNTIISKIDLDYDIKVFKRITFAEFDNLLNIPERKSAPVKEIAWVRSLDYNVIMCIVLDLIDNDYGYAIYRLKNDVYELEDVNNSIISIEDVSSEMFDKVIKIISK